MTQNVISFLECMASILSAELFYTTRADARRRGMSFWLRVSYFFSQHWLDQSRLTPDLDTSDVALDQDPLAGDKFTVLNGDYRVSGKCDCQEKVVSRKHFKAIFEGLDPEEHYFPMVSRTDPQAFFGHPPQSVRPKVWDRIIPTRSAVLENKSTPRFGTSNSNYRPPSAYDEEDEDDFVDVGQNNHSDIYEALPAPRVRRQPKSESSGSRFDTPAPTTGRYRSGPPPVNRTFRVRFNPVLLIIDDCI
jgi:hypothetical protein